MRIMDEKIQQYSTTKQYYTYSTLKKLGTCTVVEVKTTIFENGSFGSTKSVHSTMTTAGLDSGSA